MGLRIEKYVDSDCAEWVIFTGPNGRVQNVKTPHADFKRACCEAFGLVDFHALPKHVQGIVIYSDNQPSDLDANASDFAKRYADEQAKRLADMGIHSSHASKVLADASRRLV